jgi:hypothetical protein
LSERQHVRDAGDDLVIEEVVDRGRARFEEAKLMHPVA